MCVESVPGGVGVESDPGSLPWGRIRLGGSGMKCWEELRGSERTTLGHF